MGEGPTQICEVCQPNNRPKVCYRSGSTAGGTPQRFWVRSPSGANFSSGVKKKLSRLSHVQNTVEPGLTHKATPPVYGWGRGSGVFLGCCEKVILPLKQCRGGSLTPRRSSFVSPIIVKLIVPFGISSLVERKRKTKHIATQKKSIKFVSQLATIGDFVNINIRRFSLFFYVRVYLYKSKLHPRSPNL